MSIKIILDYTDQARPLSLSQIKHDFDTYYAETAREPVKIVLWEYQLDWLIKYNNLYEPPLCRFCGGQYKFNPRGQDGPGEIWGVPVEIRES